jgi:hypothetical protein
MLRTIVVYDSTHESTDLLRNKLPKKGEDSP